MSMMIFASSSLSSSLSTPTLSSRRRWCGSFVALRRKPPSSSSSSSSLRRGRRGAITETPAERIVAKRKASSKQARKVQLREDAREMQRRREERERREREEMERRPEPPMSAALSLGEANERVREADSKFQSAVDSTREIKKMKRESEEWDPQIGYGKFREVVEQVSEMNGLRVRTYETRLERAVFLIELAKALGNEENDAKGISDDAVVANDVKAVGKTLDAFDWVYGKELVDESNARTLEFMLRASQKKSQNDGLKPEISFEILNVALAADALKCINNKDNVIQKHMKRVQRGIDEGLISPDDDAATALLEKIDAFLQEQEQ